MFLLNSVSYFALIFFLSWFTGLSVLLGDMSGLRDKSLPIQKKNETKVKLNTKLKSFPSFLSLFFLQLEIHSPTDWGWFWPRGWE